MKAAKRFQMTSLVPRALITALVIAVGMSQSSCSSSGKGAGGSTASGAGSGGSVFSSRSKAGYQLSPYEEKQLENGLKILFVPDQTLPYVSYSLMIRAGAVQDPEGLSGLSAMVMELIDKGTKRRSAVQIAEDLGQLGAEFDASASLESSSVSASALSTQAEALLKNVLEIVTEPTFSEVEVERVRKQMTAGIQRRVDNPDAFGDQVFAQYLYGEHPYSRAVSGTVKSVGMIKKKHIIQHYLRYIRPNNAVLAVVGQYTPELRAQIEKEFGQWAARDVVPTTLVAAPAVVGAQALIVDKPGLVQAQIRVGHLGIARASEDFIAVRVANTILGGAFASRLNDRIRKDLGLTYSISSGFDARLDRGPFEIATFTKNNSVGQTVDEILKVLTAFRESGINSEELERAKGYLKGVFPAAIETPEKLAMNLMVLRFYGIPDSYLTDYLANIDRLSLSDVNGAIRKYFDPKNIKVLVYTNAQETVGQLKSLSGLAGVEVKMASEFQ